MQQQPEQAGTADNPNIRIRVIRHEAEVSSNHSNPIGQCVYVDVPKVIIVNIYPKGGHK